MRSVSVVLKKANGKTNTMKGFDHTEGFVFFIKGFFIFSLFLDITTTTLPNNVSFFKFQAPFPPSKQYFG